MVGGKCLPLIDRYSKFVPESESAKRISLDQESRTIITGKYSPDRMEKHIMEKKQGIGFLNDILPYGLPCVLLPELPWDNGFRQYRKP